MFKNLKVMLSINVKFQKISEITRINVKFLIYLQNK